MQPEPRYPRRNRQPPQWLRDFVCEEVMAAREQQEILEEETKEKGVMLEYYLIRNPLISQ